MHLRGTYVVSGGASGLGAAIADEIAEAGGTPIVFDVRPAGRHESQPVDVSDPDVVMAAIDDVVARHGTLNGIVANAGIDACGPFDKVPFEAWQRVINVNLIGVAALVRAALPHVEAAHGRIVTVGSTLGLRALSDATAYCASKFGVVGFTRALRAEMRGRVGVTLLLPGGMSTSFFDGRDPQYKPGPDAQLNRPADVARAVVFALAQPHGCDVAEMLICPNQETSWP
jgi:NAD(P)-dependent dehydrogenase (short-subunit alcohol dehydrogenase family)